MTETGLPPTVAQSVLGMKESLRKVQILVHDFGQKSQECVRLGFSTVRTSPSKYRYSVTVISFNQFPLGNHTANLSRLIPFSILMCMYIYIEDLSRN